MINDIIRKAARRRPHLAEDLAQEARIAAWQAAQVRTDPRYIRRAARYGMLNLIRREEKTRHAVAPVLVPLDVEPAAPFAEPVGAVPGVLSRDLETCWAAAMSSRMGRAPRDLLAACDRLREAFL